MASLWTLSAEQVYKTLSFAGISQIVYAFQSRGAGQVVWKLIIGFLYLLAGILVVSNPLEGVLTLTLVLGITIFVQGMIQVSIAFQMRSEIIL